MKFLKKARKGYMAFNTGGDDFYVPKLFGILWCLFGTAIWTVPLGIVMYQASKGVFQ